MVRPIVLCYYTNMMLKTKSTIKIAMNRFALGILSIFLIGFMMSCSHSSEKAEEDPFTLTVELNTPFNKNFIMKTTVIPGRHFEFTKLNGEVKNRISGELKPPVDGKYRLDLTVSERKSDKSHLEERAEVELEPGKPSSWGPVSSFIYSRTVTISKTK